MSTDLFYSLCFPDSESIESKGLTRSEEKPLSQIFTRLVLCLTFW
jgi:hypothetical protein